MLKETREPSKTTEKVLTLNHQQVLSSTYSKQKKPIILHIVDNRFLLFFNWTFSVPLNHPSVTLDICAFWPKIVSIHSSV